MARYLKGRTKLSRRVGRNLFLKGARSYTAKDDFTKRPFKTSSSGKRGRPNISEYSKQLSEKQALKFTYGILEKQLSNVFKKAFAAKGDTGVMALTNLERRFDNVVYKGGLANSRSQARQLVSHGHFLLNGKKANIPSMLVKAGDIITIKENKIVKPFWTQFQLQVPAGIATWIDTSKTNQLTILNLPIETDLPQDFSLASIVEYYSRKVA